MSTPPRPTRAEQHAALCASSRQRHAGGLCTEMTCNQGSRRRQLNDCHRTILCAGTSALSDLPGGHLRATSSISCGQHPPPISQAQPGHTRWLPSTPNHEGETPARKNGKNWASGHRGGARHCPAAPARNTIPLRQPQTHRPPTQRESKRGGKRLTPGTAKLRRRN